METAQAPKETKNIIKILGSRLCRFVGHWRHVFILLLIIAVCAAVFGWAGTAFLPDAADQSRREIVSDDYASLTAPLTAGGELRQTLQVEGRLYGVVLNVATFNRVPHGTLHLRLVDATGNTVATCDEDMTRLLDNTFHRFLFTESITAQQRTTYTLVITASPETPQDVVAFWRSDGPAEDFVEENADAAHYPLASFSLMQDGQAVDGTLALQYTVRYAGNFIYGVYVFFAVWLTLVLVALYVLLFMVGWPLHRVFLAACLGIGFVFLFLIPPRMAPDEYAHISVAYHQSNQILGTAQNDTRNQLWMRSGDEMQLDRYDYTGIDIFAYQDIVEGLFSRAPGGTGTLVNTRIPRTFPTAYMAPTFGVVVARLLGVGRIPLLILGRLANLCAYTVITSRAIRRLPLAKPLLFCVALSPICLQSAASFSYDASVLFLSFYLTAYLLDCIYVRPTVGLRQVMVLGALSLLLSPVKAVYIILVLLVLLIPKAKYPSARFCWLARAAILGVGLLAWSWQYLAFIGNTVVSAPASTAPTPQQLVSAVGDNGDSGLFFNLPYILRNIPQTLKLVANTLWTQPPLWLQGMLGGRMGEIIAVTIENSWIFVIGILFVLLLSSLATEKDDMILRASHRWWFLIAFTVTSGLVALACITWTPINYTIIFGIQGRYFLPVLPLLLLAIRPKCLRFSASPGRGLCWVLGALVTLVTLSTFLGVIAL